MSLVCVILLLQQVVVVGVDGVQQVLADRILGEALVVDEEEYEKHGVRRREGDTGDHVDRFGHPDRVRWLLFPHLDEACLERIEGKDMIFSMMKPEYFFQQSS